MSTFKLTDYGVNLVTDTSWVTCERTDCDEWLLDEFHNGCTLAQIAFIGKKHHDTHHREPHLEGNGQ